MDAFEIILVLIGAIFLHGQPPPIFSSSPTILKFEKNSYLLISG